MKSVFALLLSSLLFAACGDDDGTTSGTDSGPGTDAAAPTDSGGGGTDTGMPGTDSGGPTDGGGGTDAGGPTDSGPPPPPGDAGPTDTCGVAEDCVWGEIDHEINGPTDCICLFGCPSLIQNRETVDRRNAQYAMHCDPSVDGMGNPCPIDDCIPPPPLMCIEGTCRTPM